MAKLVFFAVLVAAIAAVSVAESEAAENFQPFSSMQCQRELQESSLDACRQVVDRRLAGMPFFYPRSLRWSMGMRLRCCQQLQDVSRRCRCAAIGRMVRDYEQQTMAPLGEEYYPEQQQQEQGYYGETEQRQQQQGEGFYGETAQQQQQQGGQEYYGCPGRCTTIWPRGQQPAEQEYGDTAQYQEGQEYYYGSPSRQRRYSFPPRFGTEKQQQTTRVRLTRARQYAAQLPAMCRLEPQDCSVFYSGQYQY